MNDHLSRPPKSLSPLIRLIGWATLVSAFGVGVVLVAHDLLSGHTSPYTGVLTYMLVPGFIGLGIFLILWGWYLRFRFKKKYGDSPAISFIIDLNDPSHLKRIVTVAVVLLVFGSVSAIGGYRSFHYTESTEFCGLVCHQVMVPEYTTYSHSPHARVACVECHIGAGAEWYARAKLSGLRQVYAYLANTYHLPIDTPVANLRPARETCEECHWPEKFTGNLEKTKTYYLRDEENTPYTMRMLLKVGGGHGEHASGIHWHVTSGHKIEYITTDTKRRVIPWIKMTDPDGTETVFTSEDFDPEILDSTHEMRTMDCIDCHNRPSHVFKDPEHLLNAAMDRRDIDPAIPSVKDTAMTLLEEPYPSTEKALETIQQAFQETYLADGELAGTTLETSVKKAMETLQTLYQENFFPEMGVDWTTHPNFQGHFHWDGCYRCHDGSHTSETGEVISHDCNNCHTIIAQGEGLEAIREMTFEAQEFYHPMDMGPLEEGDNCSDCHAAPEPTDYHALQGEKMEVSMGVTER